jgi:hypothetical protein
MSGRRIDSKRPVLAAMRRMGMMSVRYVFAEGWYAGLGVEGCDAL